MTQVPGTAPQPPATRASRRPAPGTRRRLARLLATIVLPAALLATGCSRPAATAHATGSPTLPEPSVSSPSPEPSPSPPPASPSPTAFHYVFPVGAHADYGRTHHDYPATDIFAACGSPVRAAMNGVVLEVSRVDTFDPANPLGADKGGLSVSIRGDDGVRYYGSHLSAIAPGIGPGVRVAAGTVVGKVGQTGNASHICHLHFGISPPCGLGDWWTRRGVIWPWRYLDAWRVGHDLSPVAEVRAWRAAHGCPTAPPPGIA